MTTSLFVSEANKLRNIQLNLQKNEQILLEHIRKYADSRIAEYHRDLEIARNKEIEMSRDEVRNIFKALNKIKIAVHEDVDSIDLKQLKEEMICIQNGIQNVKLRTGTNLNNLEKVEKQLEEELKTYEQKMQEWGKMVNTTPSSFKDTVNSANTKVDQNITNFLTFVTKNGGHENGWSPEDHCLFIKVRAKCKNKEEVAEYVHAILPDISEEEIIGHENWFVKYLALKSKHRQVIKNWRQTKSAVQPNGQKQIRDSTRATSSHARQKDLTKEEIQEKLEAWKQEKKEKLENERRLKMQAQLRKRELEEKRKQRSEELKADVKSWRCANIEKEQTERLEKSLAEQQEKQMKAALANRLIKEFQSQDDIFMRRKIKSCKPKIRSMEKLSTSVVIPRDPSRLLKPTKQWIFRIKVEENESKVKDVCDIKYVPKLGVPEWRKHLST